MKILDIRNVTKSFGDFIAVDDISLSVNQGEIFGFLGPNGAGKSTTIHMIASLVTMTKGHIELLGKDIRKHKKFAKSSLGLVPQEIAVYEEMTAYENVEFFAGLYGLRGKQLKERVEQALAFVGLEEKQKMAAKTFSGGMKRRLNIACAIAHHPPLIIMDEPTVGIDPQSRSYILQSIKKLNALGSTIIYTSHYMEEVEEICTRIAIIDHGKIIAEGTKEQLKSIITDQNRTEIRVRSAESVETVPLERIPGVRSVMLEDHRIIVESDAEVNNLNEILRQLTEKQVEILSVEAVRPDLETVFLTLTGRSLRDD